MCFEDGKCGGKHTGLEGLKVRDMGEMGGVELGGSPVHRALMFLQVQGP